ncbi:hypothetical protein TSUD_286290 [Trifolium subterraneum]|uniref:Uncharacterized protein n=1 Tax=Trifolium subterraneum TaxID=3900 RepID=A0A2Z6N6G0_TRISU|nr:hypothetical protein TSUD_286290 [Trifolium subterraneum]
MKPFFLSLTLTFLLFGFTTGFSLTFSNDEQVLDTNGNPIISGGEYYIFPATLDHHKGGLRLAKTGDSKCPDTILQNVNITGLPLKFTIPNISNGIILVGTKLDIEFTKKPNCVKSSKWLIVYDSEHDQNIFHVGIGDHESKPETSIPGIFYIKKYDNAYKIEFCFDDDMGGYNCKNVMRWKDFKEGESPLVVLAEHVQDPYPVVFVDAPSFESGIAMDVMF